MNRRLKLAILTLLGFSPACSTVKNPRTAAAPAAADTVFVCSDTLRHMIRVMYGVRPPFETKDGRTEQTDSAAAAPKAVVTGYGASPRRMMVAYGVPSPKDSVAAQPDSIRSFKCVIPPPPKAKEPNK